MAHRPLGRCGDCRKSDAAVIYRGRYLCVPCHASRHWKACSDV